MSGTPTLQTVCEQLPALSPQVRLEQIVRTSPTHIASHAVPQQKGSTAQIADWHAPHLASNGGPDAHLLRAQDVAQVIGAASTPASREAACFGLVGL
jgi:hypothetical protein